MRNTYLENQIKIVKISKQCVSMQNYGSMDVSEKAFRFCLELSRRYDHAIFGASL